jgi:AraC-like DNA-binding protein
MAKSAFAPSNLSRADAALALRVPYLFERIGIALTLVDPEGWHAVHTEANVVSFEIEHGLEVERANHNERWMREAARNGQTAQGEHFGFTDIFVPVVEGTVVRQMLVAGPFLRAPSTAAELVERWRALTGRHAHTTDPELARYAAETLATVVLDDERLAVFKKLIEQVAALASGRGDPGRLLPELERMTYQVAEARFGFRMWDAAREMVDPSTTRTWASPQRVDQRHELGLDRIPEHALVALMASREEHTDAVDELVQRDGFQKACVELAHNLGNVVTGQIGNHGVMFLLGPESKDSQVRSRFVAIASRAGTLARKLGFRLHVGTSSGTRGDWLPARYHAALAAAEEALSRGIGVVRASDAHQRTTQRLAELRRTLSEADPRRPLDLSTRFERYLEVVGAHAGYRLETARLHLEAGFERLSEPFIVRGVLDARSLNELAKSREEGADAARTVKELIIAYRRAAADLEGAIRRPSSARREVSLRKATAFIRDHLGEPLRLTDVARAGGLAPNYFSRLFKARERINFEQYVQRLRAERAKQLLARTTLNVESVGRLCGFASGPYFHRVFKQVIGVTPSTYRKDAAVKFRTRSAR